MVVTVEEAEHGPRSLPDFPMTSLVGNLNSRGEHPSLPAGKRGKSHPSPLRPPVPLVALGGWPWPGTVQGSPGHRGPCAPPVLAPPSPGAAPPRLSPPGSNLQDSNPAFPVVFLPERRSLSLESFRAGAIPGRGWRQRLPLPEAKYPSGEDCRAGAGARKRFQNHSF